MTFYSENSLYKNIYKYFEFLSWNKMLFICPNLDFLSSSNVLLPSSSALFSQQRQLSNTFCMINTKQTAVLHSRRGLQMLFQHKFDCYAGREGPLSLPALEEAQNCSGDLAAGSVWSWASPVCQTLLPECNTYLEYSTNIMGFHFLSL